MPYSELTKKHLDNLKIKIQDVMSSKGMDNSGNASQSLEVNGNQLLGNDYIYYLDQGRKPGRFPPVDAIREWVRSKLGLSGKEGNSVSYLIGRKLANEGSEIHKDKSKGIQLDQLIEDIMNDIIKELPDVATAEALKWL